MTVHAYLCRLCFAVVTASRGSHLIRSPRVLGDYLDWECSGPGSCDVSPRRHVRAGRRSSFVLSRRFPGGFFMTSRQWRGLHSRRDGFAR